MVQYPRGMQVTAADLRKLPVFEDVSDLFIQTLLTSSSSRVVPKGVAICQQGAEGGTVAEACEAQRRVLEFLYVVARELLVQSFWVPNALNTQKHRQEHRETLPKHHKHFEFAQETVLPCSPRTGGLRQHGRPGGGEGR